MSQASEQTAVEMKHTPGPWRINRRAATCVEDANGRTIATTATVASNRPGEADRIHEENLGNALMIAATPDFEAACAMWILVAGINGAVLPEDLADWAAAIASGEKRTAVEATREAIGKALGKA